MIKNEEIEKLKRDLIFQPLNSMQELQDWMYLYFDIYFPSGVVYPTSTHGPADAMWRIYELMKTGKSAEVPEVVMKASRDSGKTLAAAALEVLCMIHFRISLCHMAAISSQSLKAVQYVELFFRKIEDYLLSHNWSKNSSNKRMIEWIDDTGQNLYLKIVIATIAGANCLDPETIITTKKGDKKISEVVVGEDEILTRDYRIGEDLYQPVSHKEYTQKQTMEVLFEDGSNLICSTDHQIFTTRGWITADQIKLGESVIKSPTGDVINTTVSSTEIKPKRDLEQLLLGTLLGDASFKKTTGKRVRYSVGHCEDQREYIEMMCQVLMENSIYFKIYEGFKKTPGYENVQKTITLKTRTEDLFQELYKLTHTDHKKRVSKEWIDRLNAEGFAYFVMDDGCVGSKKIGKGKESFLDLATCSFDEEENTLIVNRLKELGINSYIYKVSNSVKTYPIIRIEKEDSRKFSEMIEPYFVNCLRYKLRTPKNHIKFRRYIDTAKPMMLEGKDSGQGFRWEDKKLMRSHKVRTYIKKIRRQLNLKVVDIKRIGKRELIDLSIKTEDEHLKSFYANNILVHNSEHVPMLFCDEIDVIQDFRALSEAKLIPSNYKNFQPLMIYLSTLKFSGGLMQQTLDSVKKNGGEVLSWNVIDITERITPEVARVDEPRVIRYVSTALPMVNLSSEQWKALKEEDKNKYEKIEAYAGIAEHPMLPVMKNYLVDRPEKDKGGLFKKLFATHNMFKKVSPEMADAQLLCHKPESTNLVYPRFDTNFNTLTVAQAWEKITGNVNPHANFQQLRDFLIAMGCPFIGGGDFGFSDYNSFVVIAMLPGGHTLQVDHFLGNNMEPDDTVAKMVEIQKHWNIEKWFVDQNRPDIVKTLRKRGLKVPDFTKDVAEGIGAFQSRIVDSSGVRKFFILNTPENNFAIEAFGFYRWALDGKGEIIEGKPHHDRDGYSDYFDSIRYIYQNLFAKNNKVIFSTAHSDKEVQKPKIQNQSLEQMAEETNKVLIQNKMQELIPEGTDTAKKARTTKKILWM